MKRSSISVTFESPLPVCNPWSFGNGASSPLRENRVCNHGNLWREAFTLTRLEWKRVALFHFWFGCLSGLCTSQTPPPRHESKSRTLRGHRGSLRPNEMRDGPRFLCGVSLGFHIGPSELSGWVMSVTSLFLSFCAALSQGFLLVGRWIWRFEEDAAALVKEYCANFYTVKKKKEKKNLFL